MNADPTVTSLFNTQAYNHKHRLSVLQKRILTYARKAMLDKQQTIDNSEIILEIPAPGWLSDALVKAMNGVFQGRKYFRREADNEESNVELGMSRFTTFFDEVSYVEETIQNAAKEAGIEKKSVRLTQLYEWCAPAGLTFLVISADATLVYYPWPYCDGRGWYFKLKLRDSKIAKSDIPEELKSICGDGWENTIRLALNSYPINCTIPELLRDLYKFPVNGHVDGIAFDPDLIGRHRYNVAQAGLRRACSRLWDRRLIVMRSGRSDSLDSHIYIRSGIGLTDDGVTVADGLITSMPGIATTAALTYERL
jgi:hypothetical protein